MNNPCMNCTNRYPACSCHCDKYAEFRQDFDKRKAWLIEQNQKDYAFYNRPFMKIGKATREHRGYKNVK